MAECQLTSLSQSPGEEIAFTARQKIHSHSQIFRYGRSIFCLPHRLKFSDFFDLCLHWVSVVCDIYTPSFLCTLELKQWQVQFGTQILTRDLLLPWCCCLLPAVLYSFFRTLGLGPDLSHRYCPNADHMSHDFPAAAAIAAAASQLYLHRYVSEVGVCNDKSQDATKEGCNCSRRQDDAAHSIYLDSKLLQCAKKYRKCRF